MTARTITGWDSFPTDDTLLGLLAAGEMVEAHGLMPWSSNYTFLVTVRRDELETLAVYKPAQGERPLWDFPHGTLADREVAAYLVSTALGWDFVPPTLVREGLYGPGAVQVFIQADFEQHYFTLREAHIPVFQRVAVFDALINNADRKAGHCLLDKAGQIWVVDHGLSFHVEDKLRTVIWDFAGDPLPDDLLADLQRLEQELNSSRSVLLSGLTQRIAPDEIKMFRCRLENLIASAHFPRPGSQRCVPYPLV